MQLSEKQKQLVTDSFARIIPISDKFATVFYANLWEIAPETKRLFVKTDMDKQRKKLMKIIGATVTSLYNLESITPTLRELGKRHQAYRVSREQYETMGQALFSTLEQELGQEFTPEVKEAWTDVYTHISEIAISAYE